MKTEKKFIKPDVEIITFTNDDIITKSGDMEDGEFDENQVP